MSTPLIISIIAGLKYFFFVIDLLTCSQQSYLSTKSTLMNELGGGRGKTVTGNFISPLRADPGLRNLIHASWELKTLQNKIILQFAFISNRYTTNFVGNLFIDYRENVIMLTTTVYTQILIIDGCLCFNYR